MSFNALEKHTAICIFIDYDGVVIVSIVFRVTDLCILCFMDAFISGMEGCSKPPQDTPTGPEERVSVGGLDYDMCYTIYCIL